MTRLAEVFNDPLDPARSIQLNNKYWKGEPFEHLDLIREAEHDLRRFKLGALKRSLGRVRDLLPEQVRSKLISRIIYSLLYTAAFEPIRFSIRLSDEFVRANRYEGPKEQAELDAKHTDELKYIVRLVHDIYRDYYGMDILSSAFAIRFIRANETTVHRMTRHGAFSDFHFDEGKDFTCILYLGPATHDSGCFTYIDGSYYVPKSHVLRALHQIVDYDLRLEKPEERAQLPLELRGSLSVGTYLDEDKRDRVLSAAVAVDGDMGDGIIFNGFDTIHRGGQPMSGERTALFISTRGHVNGRMKNALYGRLARLWL